jgi:hypothetical protein
VKQKSGAVIGNSFSPRSSGAESPVATERVGFELVSDHWELSSAEDSTPFLGKVFDLGREFPENFFSFDFGDLG